MTLLLAALLGAAAAPPACYDGPTQGDLNDCAAQEFKIADAALNRQWAINGAAMKAADRDYPANDGGLSYFDALLASQRAWLRYRDAQCVTEAYDARGGSMEPMLYSQCLAKLTQQRTTQLRAQVEGN